MMEEAKREKQRHLHIIVTLLRHITKLFLGCAAHNDGYQRQRDDNADDDDNARVPSNFKSHEFCSKSNERERTVAIVPSPYLPSATPQTLCVSLYTN